MDSMRTGKPSLRAELKELESPSLSHVEKSGIAQSIRSGMAREDSKGFAESLEELMFRWHHSSHQALLAPFMSEILFGIAENFALPLPSRKAATFNLAVIGCSGQVDANRVISRLSRLGGMALPALEEIIFQHTTPETKIVLSAADAISKIKSGRAGCVDPFCIPDEVVPLGGWKKRHCFRALRNGERRVVLCTPDPPHSPRLCVRFSKPEK
jgi:hypothetical protein